MAILKGEYGEILSSEEASAVFWANKHYFIGSALFGIVVNFASFLVVQATSGVMLKILNIVRTAGCVIQISVSVSVSVSVLQGVTKLQIRVV